MPHIGVDGKKRAILTDFLTPTFPGGRWPFSYNNSFLIKGAELYNNLCYYRTNELSWERDHSWAGSVFGGYGQPTLENNTCFNGQWTNADDDQDDVRAVLQSHLDVLFAGTHLVHTVDYAFQHKWVNDDGEDVPVFRQQHYLDLTAASTYDTVVADLLAMSREMGVHGYKPIAGCQDAVQEYVATGIAENNWGWVIPQVQYPYTRPLATPQTTVGTSLSFPWLCEGDTWQFFDVRSRFYRRYTGENADKVPWIQVLRFDDCRAPADQVLTKAHQPEVTAGFNPSITRSIVVETQNLDPALSVHVAHFETIPTGDEEPVPFTSAALAQTLGGVTLHSGTGWDYWGIPGLVLDPTADTAGSSGTFGFNWYGQYEANLLHPTWANHPVHVTFVVCPTGLDTSGMSELDDLLVKDGVKVLLDANFYPEAIIGPEYRDTENTDWLFEGSSNVGLKFGFKVTPDGGRP